MTDDVTTHVTDLKNCVIIVRNVPCLKCDQCGEVAYIGTVVKQLEKIINSMKTVLSE
jgi:YgiT-type zinc finger domain-containing protein